MTTLAASQPGWLRLGARITHTLAPAALFLLALAPRLFLIWRNPFDGLYGQDAYAYYDYARQLLDALARGQLPPPFWWPLGYPMLLNAGFLVLGVGIRSAQLVTILCGASIAPLVFLLALEATERNQIAGLIAGGTVALGGQAVQSSLVVMADVSALMWATTSAYLLLRYRRTRGTWPLALSGVTLALSIVTRWENLLFAIAWFAALMTMIAASSNNHIRGNSTLLLKQLAVLALVAVVLLPQLAFQFAHGAPLAGQSWLEGWNPTNFFARAFDTPDGHFAYALPVALFYAQVAAHPAYVFPLLTPFVLIGAWSLMRRRERVAAILLLGWIGAAYVFLAGIPYENFRFGLEFVTPVAVLAGIGIAQTWDKLRGGAHERAQSSSLAALVLFAFVGMIVWEPRVLAPVLKQKELELAQIQWLDARVPREAMLYAFGVTAALKEYGAWRVADLSESAPGPGHAEEAYAFVDVTNVETQWHGHPLQQTFDTLRTQPGFQPVGTMGSWTLFRVGGAP
jgi:Dolichyl-phosphate-mannose-protein mannosyltransferase